MKDEELTSFIARETSPYLELYSSVRYVFGNEQCQSCKGMFGNKNCQRTSYCEEEYNWEVLCPVCQIMMDDYWDERWEEYYNSVL